MKQIIMAMCWGSGDGVGVVLRGCGGGGGGGGGRGGILSEKIGDARHLTSSHVSLGVFRSKRFYCF